MNQGSKVLISAVLVVVQGCEPLPWGDRMPPRLLATEISPDGRELALAFDEPLASAEGGLDGEVNRPAPVHGDRVEVALPPTLKPGSGHVWAAEVIDESQNTSSVAGKFYAPNPSPARLRLNEVRTAGSGVHTDMVELRVEADGNLGGWTLEAWSSPEARVRLVLPDQEAHAGDLVVVRFRDPKDPVDTAVGAREYWPPQAKGLPGTKGLILLRQSPETVGIDGLLYSKRAGEASPIADAAGWVEKAELDPTPCTATRSWSRTESGNWIVTANGGATPGAPNKLTPWAGPSTRGGSSTSTKKTNRRRGGR